MIAVPAEAAAPAGGLVSVVVVLALLTITLSELLLELEKLESPLYCATIECSPIDSIKGVVIA